MNNYRLVRPLLMRLDEEIGHKLALKALQAGSQLSTLQSLQKLSWRAKVPDLPIELFGRTFRNPVGLAAGFDKDGIAIPAFESMGFGFIEVGTVTPKPQPGNSGKRIFRIDKDEAIVNRLGFNSAGLWQFQKNLHKAKPKVKNMLLGVNVGKNSATEPELTDDDYVEGFRGVYPYADYVVLNLSSPNTPGLREMQGDANLSRLLDKVMQERVQLASEFDNRVVPVAVKISPDLSSEQIHSISQTAMTYKLDAIVATNTTVARPEGASHQYYHHAGGLSGKPLKDKATHIIKTVSRATNGSIPIIGVGGISSAEDAWEKMLAGASVVQIYSALVFQGPSIVDEITRGLAKIAEEHNASDFKAAQESACKSTI